MLVRRRAVVDLASDPARPEFLVDRGDAGRNELRTDASRIRVIGGLRELDEIAQACRLVQLRRVPTGIRPPVKLRQEDA